MGTTNIQDRFDRAMTKLVNKAKHANEYDAKLGSSEGDLWSDRDRGMVWARIALPTGIVEREVVCRKVNPQLNLPVSIGVHRKGYWEVLEEDPEAALIFWDGAVYTSGVGLHGFTHLYGSLDPTIIDGRQLMHGRITPTDTMSQSVIAYGAFFRYAGEWKYVITDEIDLSGYIPVSPNYQLVAVVGIDKSEGTWDVVVGDEVFNYVTNSIPFDADDIVVALQNAADDFEPIAAVRLHGNQSEIHPYDIFHCSRSVSTGDQSLAATRCLEFNSRQLNMGASLPGMSHIGFYPYVTFGISDGSNVTFKVPTDWDSISDFTIKIRWLCEENYAVNSGEVRWDAAWACCPADCSEDVDPPTHWNTDDSGDVEICTTANHLSETTVAVIPASDISVGDQVGVRLRRVTITDGNNPTADVGVITMLIEYGGIG